MANTSRPFVFTQTEAKQMPVRMLRIYGWLCATIMVIVLNRSSDFTASYGLTCIWLTVPTNNILLSSKTMLIIEKRNRAHKYFLFLPYPDVAKASHGQ